MRRPPTSQPAGRKVGRSIAHRIFLFHTARRTLKALLFPYREICTHNKSLWDPLFTLGRSDFATSRGQWSSVGLSNPRNPTTVNADLFLSGFSLSRFRHSRCRTTCFPDSRFPICRNSDTRASLTFQRPSLHRHFGVRNIANPDAMFRDFSPRNPDMVCHLSTSLTLVAPHYSLAVGISRIMISRFLLQCLRSFNPRNPDIHESTCKSDGPCGSDLRSCPS
jgi:hypothetical protein